MLDFISFESLQKIEPQNLIETTEKINQSISEDTTQIPSRIEAIIIFFEVFININPHFFLNY